MIATIPATAILFAFGSLHVEAEILRLPVAATLAAGWIAMGLAGAVYGRLLQRAASDRGGGWLFGMAFGFLLWTAGAVMILPAVSGGSAPAGTAAIGVFVSLLAWGTALGALFPFIHRALSGATEGTAQPLLTRLGPNAAVSDRPGPLERNG